jgi:hypothetical protein
MLLGVRKRVKRGCLLRQRRAQTRRRNQRDASGAGACHCTLDHFPLGVVCLKALVVITSSGPIAACCATPNDHSASESAPRSVKSPVARVRSTRAFLTLTCAIRTLKSSSLRRFRRSAAKTIKEGFGQSHGTTVAMSIASAWHGCPSERAPYVAAGDNQACHGRLRCALSHASQHRTRS